VGHSGEVTREGGGDGSVDAALEKQEKKKRTNRWCRGDAADVVMSVDVLRSCLVRGLSLSRSPLPFLLVLSVVFS